MNRLTTILAAVALVFVAVRAQGSEATTSSARGIRIAYVDLDRVASNSQMVKDRVGKVQVDLEAKQKDFKAKADELRQLRQQLTQQESVLSASQQEQLKTRIRSLQDELDRLQYEADRILNKTSQEVIEPVLDDVLAAVERVAKATGCDLVLRGDLVLFASDRVDLTDAVIRELDKKAATTTPAVSPVSTPARRSGESPDASKVTPGKKVAPTPIVKKTPKADDGISRK